VQMLHCGDLAGTFQDRRARDFGRSQLMIAAASLRQSDKIRKRHRLNPRWTDTDGHVHELRPGGVRSKCELGMLERSRARYREKSQRRWSRVYCGTRVDPLPGCSEGGQRVCDFGTVERLREKPQRRSYWTRTEE
jgi:hypothetical protein